MDKITTTDLMQPRYKCIGKYPQSKFIIGEIYTDKECCEILNPNNVIGCLSVYSCSKYPAIFKPLEWWEERKVEDMPEYVKTKYSVRKVLRHCVEVYYYEDFTKFNNEGIGKYTHCVLSNIKEYNEYQKQKNGTN